MKNKTTEKDQLWFLRDFINAGIPQYKLAEAFDTTPQNLSVSLGKDDMKLSKIEERLAKIGYSISFTLRRTDTTGRSKDACKLLDFYYGNKRNFRLENLKLFQIAYGISNEELAQAVNLHYTAVYRWFRVDDLSVSYLYEIAKYYNAELVWSKTRM